MRYQVRATPEHPTLKYAVVDTWKSDPPVPTYPSHSEAVRRATFRNEHPSETQLAGYSRGIVR